MPDGAGLPARGQLRRRRPARGRRRLPLPAHARRDGPAPDQRGPARAAVAGARLARPALRQPVRHDHRHLLRGVGAARPGRPGEGRLQQLGRPRAPDAADGRAPGCGSSSSPASAPARSYKYVVLGADGEWREKADPLAARTEEPPATSSVVLRVAATTGATTTGWPPAPRATPHEQADVGLRGAPRLVAPRPVVPRHGRRAGRPTSRRWASPTSSCCR